MKLTSLQIDDFRQFKDFRLDLTDPETGKPLEKVCFIGPNGTGKSTLLGMIARQSAPHGMFGRPSRLPVNGTCRWDDPGFEPTHPINHFGAHPGEWVLPVVFCSADAEGDFRENWGPEGMPITSLNEALDNSRSSTQLAHDAHAVSMGNVASFWTRLIVHIKQREQAYLAFQRLPENRDKTISQLDAEFDAANPQVMDKLADVWDRILRLAQLELDRESISVPFQLTDNLKAYLRTTSGNRVPYADLSTGIRHYLFRLGHIWSLYFNREPGDSLLLVDEPEGSLYPDFLYDIVRNYQEVAPGCQLLMATHSPIVAAQFRPEERVILSFGDDGKVTARRGVSPEGDDPNDILRQDFGVDSLMTEKGEQAYDRFLKLRRLIPSSKEPEKARLIEEYRQLGSAYHFQAPSSLNEGAA